MKLDKKFLESFTKQVMKDGTGVQQASPEGNLTTFMLDDVTVTFVEENGTNKFFGIVFEVLGRDFIIMTSGEIFLQDINDKGEQETYQVIENKLFRSLETFLEWRYNTLKNLTI